jgi:MoxR-like ATPase
MTDPAALADDIAAEMSTVLVGMDEQIEYLTVSLLSRGHVLLEGVPGVAKTTLANAFARASGLSYNRIQMTPDTLPADITGTNVYREQAGTFELQKGPIFANVVVADEINRATPKTQSALLEAMAEEHVSIESETLALPTPFLVVATQNPIEMEGTFELPEAQRDRFQFKLQVELPETDTEREMLTRFESAPTMSADDIEAVTSPAEILEAREMVTEVNVESMVHEYILDLVNASREHPDVAHGVSPRGSLALLQTAKARAAVRGREYVTSDDIKRLVEPVFRHRLVLTTDAELGDVRPESIIEEIRSSVPTPDGTVAQPEPSGDSEEASTDGNEVPTN